MCLIVQNVLVLIACVLIFVMETVRYEHVQFCKNYWQPV